MRIALDNARLTVSIMECVVSRGGVGVQLCGWIVNEDLWVGGVSDTEYNKHAGYLQKQKEFQEKDLVYGEGDSVGKVLAWLIIYDRGYRAKMAAWLEESRKCCSHGLVRVMRGSRNELQFMLRPLLVIDRGTKGLSIFANGQG